MHDDSDLLRQLKALIDKRQSEVGPSERVADIGEYRQWLLASGYAERTVTCYVANLAVFQNEGLNIFGLDAGSVITYAARSARAKRASTLATYYASLRKWAEFTGQMHAVGALKAPRIDSAPRALPPEEDVATIRDAMRPNKRSHTLDANMRRRDGVIFDLLFEAALRISEALRLELNDLLVKRGVGYAPWPASSAATPTHIHVRNSKRNKSRHVPLTPVVARSIANWVRIHRAVYCSRSSSLVFTTPDAKPVTYDTYQGRLKRYARETGVSTLAGKTHTGRRMKITRMIANKANPHAIIRHTGHKSVAELEPYVVLSDTTTEREWLEKS